MIIRVPERGSLEITEEVWLSLSSREEFWRLVDGNILSVERRTSKKWSLRASCYVGRAVIGNDVLETAEKVPGSFEALVRRIGIGGANVVATPAPVSNDDHTAALLVSLFVRAVRRYLSGNKLAEYHQQPETGSLVGGRLDIIGTARLRARGMMHQAAFFRTVLSADLPFNHAIYAALMEVERLSSILPIDPSDVSAARALRIGMSECLDGAMRTPRGQLAQLALTESLAKGSRAIVSDVASLAAAILDSAGFGGDFEWGRTVNRSWFVNLENMFERAVRLATKTELPDYNVTGPTERPSLFGGADQLYRANPDVVIRSSGTVAAIGDAKYKDLDQWPSPADTYELIAHAAAYGATKAFLVYPSELPTVIRHLGVSSTGCEVWCAAIPLAKFDQGMSELIGALQLDSVQAVA
jgi:hypothetical protein